MIHRVLESKNAKYPSGSMLVAYFGWRTHTVVNPDEQKMKAAKTGDMFGMITQLPDLGNLSPSVGLGAVGMPGNSAYFGKMMLCA